MSEGGDVPEVPTYYKHLITISSGGMTNFNGRVSLVIINRSSDPIDNNAKLCNELKNYDLSYGNYYVASGSIKYNNEVYVIGGLYGSISGYNYYVSASIMKCSDGELTALTFSNYGMYDKVVQL